MTTPTEKLRALMERVQTHIAVGCVPQHGYYSRHMKLAIDLEAAVNALPSLLAELEAAREDAERYRWLRDYNTAWHPEVTHAFYLGSDNLDAAIDAARHAAATLGEGEV